jgi:tRNA modification GTPase
MVRSARPGRDKGTNTTARLPEPWKLERCHVLDPHTSEILDEALAVFFRGAPDPSQNSPLPLTNGPSAPRSFTTEDVLELHVHGGRAVVGAVLAALARVPGCRPAAAGEFTRRAYEGGRLDLTQVEGLRDLIDADTESQRRAALRVARVGWAHFPYRPLNVIYLFREARVSSSTRFAKRSSRVSRLSRRSSTSARVRISKRACSQRVMYTFVFLPCLALPGGVYRPLAYTRCTARERAQRLRDKIQSILSDNRRGEIVRAGIRLAIFGPPNVGKSSLLNFLGTKLPS